MLLFGCLGVFLCFLQACWVCGLGRVRDVASGITDFDAGSEMIHPPLISLYFDFGYVALPQKQGQPRRVEQIGSFRLAAP